MVAVLVAEDRGWQKSLAVVAGYARGCRRLVPFLNLSPVRILRQTSFMTSP
jgi:hypothetical protein